MTAPAEVAWVDFSLTKPDPAALVRAGFRGVVGYVKPLEPSGPNPMELSATQLRAYRAAGLAVALVWETTTGRALTGTATGRADGEAARARARAIGYPDTAVIFAACDQQVSTWELVEVQAYMEGFAAGVAPHPAGAYGSHTVVEWLAARSPGLYLWQTAAWSAGKLSPRAHLYQRAIPSGHWPRIDGTDENVLCRPLPAFTGPVPPVHPAPIVPPRPVARPGFDAVAYVRGLRGKRGDTGPVWEHLQRFGNAAFGAYCKIRPTAPTYGPQTVAFLAELAHRAAEDRHLGGVNRADLVAADGATLGDDLAAALVHYGFPEYLTRVGFHG